jgi:hypothetical protein
MVLMIIVIREMNMKIVFGFFNDQTSMQQDYDFIIIEKTSKIMNFPSNTNSNSFPYIPLLCENLLSKSKL